MKKQTKILLIAFLAILLIVGTISLFIRLNAWFNTHYFVFKAPVEVTFNRPVSIEIRKVIEKKIVLDYPGEVDTDIKKYICEKFGAYDCKIALAIVQAESGFNSQAIGINKGSVDLGIWQINFPTHKGTISPADALDPYKATDWAFEKYKRDGNFNAWVVYVNESYLAKYE